MALRLLLTNDDGYDAVGINILADRLDRLAEVRVVAPDRDKSGYGHSRTMTHRPVFEETEHGRRKVYIADSTPADCVFYGLNGIFGDEEFDFVVSGINKGRNLSNDLYVSGTVGAAREAAFPTNGLIGIAASAVYDQKTDPDFQLAAGFTGTLVEWLAEAKDELGFDERSGLYLNVNVPPRSRFKGSQFEGISLTYPAYDRGTRLDLKCLHPRGERGGEFIPIFKKESVDEEPGSDYWAVNNNRISVTVLSLKEGSEEKDALEEKLLREFRFANLPVDKH